MDVTSSFVSRSVTSTVNLNWVFLVDWIIIFFASIVFIFYFNRMVGYVVTQFVTHVLWRRRKTKLSIQAIKINLLGGRIFIKNMAVVTKSELILVHSAVLTWRYWLQFVRTSQFYVQEKNLNNTVNRSLPSRFILEVTGMEVFVYNRSCAYDDIEEILKSEARQHQEKHSKHNHKHFPNTQHKSHDGKKFSEDVTSSSPSEHATYSLKHRRNRSSSSYGASSSTIPSAKAKKEEDLNADYSQEKAENESFQNNKFKKDEEDQSTITTTEVMDSTFLDFLPFEVKISKGSFVLGNETTSSLYVASFNNMSGQIDASLPGSALDYYRTHYDFTVTDLKIDLKTNVTFKDIDTLEKKIQSINNKKKTKNFISMISGLGHSINALHVLFNKHKKTSFTSADSELQKNLNNGIEEWHGLERYLTTVSSSDSDLDSRMYDYDKQRMIDTEYAKYSNILDAQRCKINYYYDSQGLVPAEKVSSDCIEDPDIGNKDIPPMFGVDITLSGATACYGPWAEKQRGSLHHLLFPPLYRNSVPFKKLKTGMRRQYVSFDLSIQCADEMVFRIPHREESKDINFLKTNIPTLRHFGWLDLKVAEGSITDVSVSFISTVEKGVDNKINAVFVKPEISTSVNHDILFEADEHILNASVAFPLEWNSLADWKFENISKNVNIYLLREHITLLTDLFSDFSSGAPTPYELFRPFIYRFNWKLYDYSIYLNINEQNIINNPLDKTINTYLTFKGASLHLTTTIPITSVYKKSNTVDYILETSYFDLSIEHPTSSTFSNFTQTEEIGNANNFKMEGSYTYFSFLEIDSVDTIIMNCTCDDTTVKVYGFAVKYFMSLKENYFGDSTHFQNLLEFRDSFGTEEKDSNAFEGKRMKNETDFMFSFCVNNGCLVFPCHLYDCMSHLALHFDDLDIDIRNNNYYMDLQADFSEIKGRYVENCDESVIFANTKSKLEFEPQIFIDGLSVHSIRIFGLPPAEPTYFCRWTFDSGDISIISEPIFLDAISRAGMSFKFGHKDLENSLDLPQASVLDILNLLFKCPAVHITLKSLDYVFKVSLIDISFKNSDQPTPCYNGLIDLIIREVLVECYQNKIQLLKVVTSLEVKNFIQNRDSFEVMKEQSMHLKKHDASFHRTPFLIPEFAKDRKYYKSFNSLISSLYLPDPPLPLTSESLDMIIDSFPLNVQKKLFESFSSLEDNDDASEEAQRFSSNLEDFGILKGLDPNCEYDNFPIKLEKLEIFISPAVAPILVDIISKMTDFNMYSFLDELQTQFITFFNFRKKNLVMRCKVECPLITFKMADSINATEYLFVGISDLVFAFSRSDVASSFAMNIYAIFKELNIDLIKDMEDAVLITFYRLLFKQSFEAKHISTVDLENLSIFVDPAYAPWIIDWGYELKDLIGQTSAKWKAFQKDKHSAGIELLYDLSRGGIDFNISHDPPCITKPSYITGFRKNHIRTDGNWMIIPRLRHVLQNLPLDWILKKNKMFSQKLWEAPKDAEDEVSIIFGNWRCWDNHKTKDNFIFKQVFDSEIEKRAEVYNTVKVTLKNFSVGIRPFTNAIIVSDVSFFLNEEDLCRKVKEFAMPLLDRPIEKSLDITFKVQSVATSFTKIHRLFDVLYPLTKEIKATLSKHTAVGQDLDNDDDMGSTASLNDVARYEAATPTLITFNFSLADYSHSLGIDESILVLYGQGIDLTASLIKAEEMLSCILNIKNQFLATELHVGRIPIFELNCESHNTTLINTGSFDLGKTVVLISNEVVSFNFLPDTPHLVKVLTLFSEKELKSLMSVIRSFKESNIGSSLSAASLPLTSSSSGNAVIEKLKSNLFSKIRMDISASISVSKFSFHFEMIAPFFTNFNMTEPVLSLKLGSFGVLAEFLMERSDWFVGSQSKESVFEYVTTSFDKLKFSLSGHYKGGIYETLVTLITGIVRINLAHNNLVNVLSRGKSDTELMLKNLDSLKAAAKLLGRAASMSTNTSSSIPSNTSKLDDNLFVELSNIIHLFCDINFGNVIATVNLNGNKFHLDCIKPKLNVKTFDPIINKFSPHGKITLPSTRIAMGLNGVHGVSTIFDIRSCVEVRNPDNVMHKSQRFDVRTDYCRLVLNPHIIDELIEAYGDIAILMEPSESRFVQHSEPIDLDEKIDSILSYISINIVAKNVCFGWLFDEEDILYPEVAPGIIIGFEDTLISCAKDGGKLQTRGMYISAAHGFTPSTFYSANSEKSSDNRAYLPLFNLIYSIESDSKMRNFRSRVNGDKIDFKFQTDIISITEPLWLSINSLQEKFMYVQSVVQQKRDKKTKRHRQPSDEPASKSPLSPFSNTFKMTSISCVFNFAGASFFIYNSHIEINGAIPILSLQSPRLYAILKYSHDILALKKHTIFFSALISETNNKLSCLCVPVLQDIMKGFQEMMRRSNGKNAVVSKETSNNGIDIVNLSEKINVNFSLKIEPQSLALTCEPRANVEAEVGLEEIHLIIKTDQDFLSVVLSIQSLRSELKHAYSKVTSGSVHAKRLTVNGAMTSIEGEKKFCTVAKLDEAEGFINIQQRQDLDLFKDLWLPSDFNNSLLVKKSKSVDEKKTFASMLREVSTTTAFPWVLSLLVAKVSAKVDLGSSLGELNVNIQNFMAVSTKSMEWDQNLKLELDMLQIESRGRLSGMLKAENTRMTSVISWKKHGEVLVVPLVLLSFGFGCLQTKISLDFHPFFILEVVKFGVTIYNQRQKDTHDNLKSSLNVESIKVFMTALTASNFVDVYTIGLRIRQDIKLSYRQVLNDAQLGFNENMSKSVEANTLEREESKNTVELTTLSQTFLNMIEKLKTYLEVNIGMLEIQVFPSSLLDSQALVINIGKERAMFYQNNVLDTENRLSLDLADITVSLSSFKNKPTAEALNDENSIKTYLDMVSTPIADNIFVFPTLKIMMVTSQNKGDNVIDYKYVCKFGGKVDIKWKIGSVYFIRQMWYSHATTLSNRLTALRIYTSDEYSGEAEENYKESPFESVNLEDRLKDVESDKKFTYNAIEEPDIETPQLKDLGNATPPLEWFGLHRDKFPNLTHQFVIIGLQKIIREVEQNYSKVLK